MSDAWFETFLGKRLDLLEPDPTTINLRDIAQSLSLENRFNGHSTGGYSVAEHSLWVWKLIALQHPTDHVLQLHAALHDAHEYATGDISKPMKLALRRLSPDRDILAEIAQPIQRAILDHLGIPPITELQAFTVKIADTQMLVTERHCPALRPHTGEYKWETEDLSPIGSILDRSIRLEPRTMLGPDVWDGDMPDFVPFPSSCIASHVPSGSHPVYRPIFKPMTSAEIGFLFEQNIRRLLGIGEKGDV